MLKIVCVETKCGSHAAMCVCQSEIPDTRILAHFAKLSGVAPEDCSLVCICYAADLAAPADMFAPSLN
jgi:hypothetical protein